MFPLGLDYTVKDLSSEWFHLMPQKLQPTLRKV